MKQTLLKSFKDILSPPVIFFAIKMGLFASVLTLFLSWALWDTLSQMITAYLAWIPWNWVQTTGVTLANILLSYMLFIMMLSLLTSIFSEKLLIALAQKSYPDIKAKGSPNITTSLFLTLKATGIFLILFILTLPLFFIPIIGQILPLYLWSILLKEPTVYDVGALFIDDAKRLEERKEKTTLLAMIASLFNYIPIANIFAPVLAQILFLHHLLQEKK
ncbi:MAG: hypothetical protein RL113_721 [Pseudomonadota bacterium]